MIKKIILTISLITISFILFSFTRQIKAQEKNFEYKEESLEATVVEILENKKLVYEDTAVESDYQKLDLLVTKGSLKGRRIIIENGLIPQANIIKYTKGDKVVIVYSTDQEGGDNFYIADFVRRDNLMLLFGLFVFISILVAGLKGILSLLGMAVSFIVIFVYILPQISQGANPVTASVIGAFLIIPFTFILSHGANKKTFVAMAGTLISLILTGVLASTFVELTKLTGYGPEEAAFLPSGINIKGLIMAGIIIGVLGILDDVTVSQSSIVQELKEANNELKSIDLYERAMKVGQDHIASVINTLVLVYTGAALPLFLLFTGSTNTYTDVLNYEIIAEEIVRTLVGSIGLILAVPITTFIASKVHK